MNEHLDEHQNTLPTFLSLYRCLSRIEGRSTPHLRFQITNRDRLEFHFFLELAAVYVHYRPYKERSYHIGIISPDGSFTPNEIPDSIKADLFPLLFDLQNDFTTTILAYGKRTGLCAICGKPLIDPSSLSYGVSQSCRSRLDAATAIPATLSEI